MSRFEVEPVAFSFSNADVGTGALEDIGPETGFIPVDAITDWVFEVKNTGATNALQNFAVLVKVHPNGNWVELLSSTAFAAVAGALQYFFGAPHTLALGTSAIFHIRTGPVYAIKTQARATGGATSVTVYARGFRS